MACNVSVPRCGAARTSGAADVLRNMEARTFADPVMVAYAPERVKADR
ncbi:MAG TPA: hypothetical protein VNE00_18380 [Paraburkholderia sp.]|jgi:hypothetical protein|nr:hypothetical protein [Paraburkholderia sp.]